MRSRTPVGERLERASAPGENGCINYTGYLDKQGYGRIFYGHDKQLVHRVAHMLYIGPIPPGYEVDHLCGNRCCVNPEHLEAVTPRVNTMRSASPSRFNAEKTHCNAGHEFTPENTRHRTDRPGRTCRRCDADRQNAYRARRLARMAA